MHGRHDFFHTNQRLRLIALFPARHFRQIQAPSPGRTTIHTLQRPQRRPDEQCPSGAVCPCFFAHWLLCNNSIMPSPMPRNACEETYIGQRFRCMVDSVPEKRNPNSARGHDYSAVPVWPACWGNRNTKQPAGNRMQKAWPSQIHPDSGQNTDEKECNHGAASFGAISSTHTGA